jgi:hypothetical protein
MEIVQLWNDVDREQGDQILAHFCSWVIVFLGHFFQITYVQNFKVKSDVCMYEAILALNLLGCIWVFFP